MSINKQLYSIAGTIGQNLYTIIVDTEQYTHYESNIKNVTFIAHIPGSNQPKVFKYGIDDVSKNIISHPATSIIKRSIPSNIINIFDDFQLQESITFDLVVLNSTIRLIFNNTEIAFIKSCKIKIDHLYKDNTKTLQTYAANIINSASIKFPDNINELDGEECELTVRYDSDKYLKKIISAIKGISNKNIVKVCIE